MMTGKVVRKNDEKGYGFIAPDEKINGKKDVFFHCSSLRNIKFDELQVGESVTFDVEDGEKGKSAKNVCVP